MGGSDQGFGEGREVSSFCQNSSSLLLFPPPSHLINSHLLSICTPTVFLKPSHYSVDRSFLSPRPQRCVRKVSEPWQRMERSDGGL